MKIVVDTSQDITQLFRMISENIRNQKINAECLLENFITVSADLAKVKKVISETVSEYIMQKFEIYNKLSRWQ